MSTMELYISPELRALVMTSVVLRRVRNRLRIIIRPPVTVVREDL